MRPVKGPSVTETHRILSLLSRAAIEECDAKAVAHIRQAHTKLNEHGSSIMDITEFAQDQSPTQLTASKALAMSGSVSDGEALSAVRRAAKLLDGIGLTIKTINRSGRTTSHNVEVAQPRRDFSFAEIIAEVRHEEAERMEKIEPGWTSRRDAREVADRLSRNQAAEEVLSLYGSDDAVFEYTEYELIFFETLRVAGFDVDHGNLFLSGEKVDAIVREAVPLPKTVTETVWEIEKINDVNAPRSALMGGGELCVAPGIWARQLLLIDHLIRTVDMNSLDDALVVLTEISIRTERYGFDDIPQTIERVQHAIEAFAFNATKPCGAVHPDTASKVDTTMTATQRRKRIEELLGDSNSRDWSDRKIAREVGASPTTVGTIRRRLAA